MPTADRRQFLRQAIEYFTAQTWPNKELVIVDDGREPANPPQVAGVRYVRLPAFGFSIGLKRNIACELANGQYIAHWDDDDRYAPDRIAHQMNHLLATRRAAVTGYNRMLFETPEGRRWRYTGPPHSVVGVSMLYEKAYWEAHPFECIRIGEDTSFGFKAASINRLLTQDGEEKIIARIHKGNTSEKTDDYLRQRPQNWEPL